jgi:hypothetical protein
MTNVQDSFDAFHRTDLGAASAESKGAGVKLVELGVEFERLALGLEARADRLAADVISKLRDKHRDLDWSAAGERREVAELCRESLRAQLRSFRAGILPDRFPQADSELLAALGRALGLRVLLDGYHLCQLTLWQAWFELIEDSLEPSAPQRRELLSRGSDFFFRYADLLGGYVAEAYQRQLGQPRPSSEQRRFRAIEELLAGDPLAASWLDLDLERHHIALIAWGRDPSGAARQLAVALGRPMLSISPPGAQPGCWAWISGTRPLELAEQRRLAQVQPVGGRIALGLEAFGEAGFRASHRQALRAHRFAAEEGPAVLRYEDVVVEALACENEDDARAFVAHELRGIDDDSSRSREIRATLAAYFESEYNAASAGARLGIHQQTVANRLRAAEERLGQTSIGLRRVELEMALRLRECISAEPD